MNDSKFRRLDIFCIKNALRISILLFCIGSINLGLIARWLMLLIFPNVGLLADIFGYFIAVSRMWSDSKGIVFFANVILKDCYKYLG